MCTRRTIPKLDWALKYKNSEVDWTHLGTGAIAVVAAVSRERGVDLAMTFRRSLNVPKYKIFLETLRRTFPFDNIILVKDNLRIHRNKEILERMDELGFRYAWTPRYSPRYNGIEEVWAMMKQWLKKERLNLI